MKSKIRVYGKSQSRTALGIINAYLKLHPDASPYEVRWAFPKSLNRRCPANHLFIPIDETLGLEKMFFEDEDEQIVFKNGERFSFVEVWSKEDFDAICKRAKEYGIEVANEGTKPFEKGSFKLELLGEWRFRWLWILLLILFLLLILLCWKKCTHQYAQTRVSKIENVQQPAARPIPSNGVSVSVVLPDGNILNIAKKSQEFVLFSFLNNPETQVDADKTKGWISMDKIHFETGRAVFLPESENQLNAVAQIMQLFPNAHIKIGGYTDDTGNDEINMKLSHERARATNEKLIALGIASNRLAYEGYGSNYPVSSNLNDEGRALNRRVDMRVTQK